jgi:beta-galactosidase
LTESVEAYIQALYGASIPFRIVSEKMLALGELDGLKLLIMPSCYYVTDEEAAALDRWVRTGGVLLNEAHLAGYNATTGRHSRVLPGGGLAQSWGIREIDSTSSHHLRLGEQQALRVRAGMTEDVRKALRDFGVTGGAVFPFSLADGSLAWGAHRYAILGGDGVTSEGSFDGTHPCAVSKPVGDGWVLYCGTNVGLAAATQGGAGLMSLLNKALARAGVMPVRHFSVDGVGDVRADVLYDGQATAFLVVNNRAGEARSMSLQCDGRWRGLFSGARWELGGAARVDVPAGFIDLFVPDKEAL